MGIPVRMRRARNLMAIVLDSKENMAGRFYTRYDTEPVEFNGVNEFFHVVNGFLDALGSPGQMYRYRKFRGTKTNKYKFNVFRGDKVHDLTDGLEKEEPDKAYALLIHTRDKATWQGAVYKKAKDKSFTFKNEIELLNILYK